MKVGKVGYFEKDTNKNIEFFNDYPIFFKENLSGCSIIEKRGWDCLTRDINISGMAPINSSLKIKRIW